METIKQQIARERNAPEFQAQLAFYAKSGYRHLSHNLVSPSRWTVMAWTVDRDKPGNVKGQGFVG
jgi:hypothetical protein